MEVKKNITNKLIDFFTKGQSRTRKAKKYVSVYMAYRCIDLSICLALVQLFLNYLYKTRYGMWMALFSITIYFNFLNIGLEQLN